MKTLVASKVNGKWRILVYSLKPLSETEIIMLGLDKVGKEKTEARNKAKKF